MTPWPSEIGSNRPDVLTPALIVEPAAMEHNLRAAAAQAEITACRLRPHFSAHRSVEVARLQRDLLGTGAVSVRHVWEAELLQLSGFDDLLVTGPLASDRQLHQATELAGRATVTLVVGTRDLALRVIEAARVARKRQRVLVQVRGDPLGQGTCPGPATLKLVRLLASAPSVLFSGLYIYIAPTSGPLNSRMQTVVNRVQPVLDMRQAVESMAIPVETVSVRSTAALWALSRLAGVTECQPDSHALMDSRHDEFPELRHALFVATTVISRVRRGMAVADAGQKAVSGDDGLPTTATAGVSVERLNAEHAILTIEEEKAGHLRVADQVSLIPTNAESTVRLHNFYTVVKDGRKVDEWPISRRDYHQ